VAASAYLLGSVLFGIVILRALKGVDPRKAGSGNPGATNVLRLGGWLPGILALVLDAGKGTAAVYLAGTVSSERAVAALAAFFVVLGHAFPLFHGWRGGKGVATGLGAFLVLTPEATAVAGVVFLAVVVAFRYVSLGSLLGALALAAAVVLREGRGPAAASAVVVAALVFFRHRENIARLLRGDEPRLGSRPPAF
jgi:glycerol-3-phosphate acyltransferase PlsY